MFCALLPVSCVLDFWTASWFCLVRTVIRILALVKLAFNFSVIQKTVSFSKMSPCLQMHDLGKSKKTWAFRFSVTFSVKITTMLKKKQKTRTVMCKESKHSGRLGNHLNIRLFQNMSWLLLGNAAELKRAISANDLMYCSKQKVQ